MFYLDDQRCLLFSNNLQYGYNDLKKAHSVKESEVVLLKENKKPVIT